MIRFDPRESVFAMYFLWGLLEKPSEMEGNHSVEYYRELLKIVRERIKQVMEKSADN